MYKNGKTQKGITLIALVITIIVMLILVGVTISMAVNGGLFNYAGKAVGDTKNALDAEGQIANGAIKVGETWYDSIDDYIAGRGWTTVYEGEATTDENYLILLSEEEALFELGYRYRISVESLEEGGYSGTIETVPILRESLEEGGVFYDLFLINEENEAGVWSNSVEWADVLSDWDDISDALFIAMVLDSEETEFTAVGIEGTQSEYKITKIEKSSKVEVNCLFVGYLNMEGYDLNNPYEMPGVTFNTDKTYEFRYTVNGVGYTARTQPYTSRYDESVFLIVSDGFPEDKVLFCFQSHLSTSNNLNADVIVMAIYEVQG